MAKTFKITYEYYNNGAREWKEDFFDNNGQGFHIWEAKDLVNQMKENGFRNVKIEFIAENDFDQIKIDAGNDVEHIERMVTKSRDFILSRYGCTFVIYDNEDNLMYKSDSITKRQAIHVFLSMFGK